MHLHSPWLFLFLIPVLIAFFYILFFQKKIKGTFRYSNKEFFSKQPFSLRVFLSPLPFLLKGIALVLLIIALVRPQSVKERSEQNVKGLDIMIVLDISLSMLLEDMGPNLTRLESAKQVVKDFIGGRVSDRIGLIVFSGESYTLVPLTLDYELLLKNLSRVQPVQTLKQGTAIGVALANASARLKHSPPKSRIMVFLTDGESNVGFIDPLTALKIVKNNKIKIYTIGLGNVSGRAPIRYGVKGQQGRQFLQRAYVDATINKELMQKMADETGGQFFMATNLSNLKQIFEKINELEKQEIKISRWTEYKEHFPPFLRWGFGFYFMAFILSLTVFFRGV